LSFIKPNETFFEGVDLNSQVWMSHSDSIKLTHKWGQITAQMMLNLPLIKWGPLMRYNIIQKYFILLMDQNVGEFLGENC
jgi:hypothetical protein